MTYRSGLQSELMNGRAISSSLEYALALHTDLTGWVSNLPTRAICLPDQGCNPTGGGGGGSTGHPLLPEIENTPAQETANQPEEPYTPAPETANQPEEPYTPAPETAESA